MKYLPHEKITYKTTLKTGEIIQRLTHYIQPEKPIAVGADSIKGTRPYKGRIQLPTFTIKRIIHYRKSFIPRIDGYIQEGADSTTIDVTIHLDKYDIIFLYACVGLALIVALPMAITSIIHATFNPMLILPFSVVLFMYLITLDTFNAERFMVERDLKEIFKVGYTYINISEGSMATNEKLVLFLIACDPGIRDMYKMIKFYYKAEFPFNIGKSLDILLDNNFIVITEYFKNNTPNKYEITEKGTAYLKAHFNDSEAIEYIKTMNNPEQCLHITQIYIDRKNGL